MGKFAVVLGLAILFISCEDVVMDKGTEAAVNPFVGTWENENRRIIFTEDEITFYDNKFDITPLYHGTYTIYDDIHIFITKDNGICFVCHYNFKDDWLYFDTNIVKKIQ